jgi:putative peptide zinc metalloprotease protein
MSAAGVQQYFVIPLSVQKEGEAYLVGNLEMGDFYHFPEQGLRILNMLKSGSTVAAIRSRLAVESEEMVDVDEFVDQLTSIGFIHPEDQKHVVQEQLRSNAQDKRRTFNVDPRIANAIFSPPIALIYLALVVYAIVGAITNPALRINFDAFYIDTNRTPLLLLILMASFVQVAMHESGHMLAAARHGIKSKYGIGNRMWTVVAESDLTGILTLPKSQRYFPMMAGLLVDILCTALLTILIQILLRHGVGPFWIQVVQAVILEIVIGMTWQFNIFVKTDIYYVLCNYLSYPDLDRDARAYMRDLVYRATSGRFGNAAALASSKNLNMLRLFAAVWVFGRLLSFLVLFGIFLPTMGQYVISAVYLLNGSPASVWMACDTIIYVSLTLTMLGTGMYMWLRRK